MSGITRIRCSGGIAGPLHTHRASANNLNTTLITRVITLTYCSARVLRFCIDLNLVILCCDVSESYLSILFLISNSLNQDLLEHQTAGIVVIQRDWYETGRKN